MNIPGNTNLNVPEELVKEPAECTCPESNGVLNQVHATCLEPIMLFSSLLYVHISSLQSATLKVLE